MFRRDCGPVVAPARPLVVDDCRDLIIVEDLGECRHRYGIRHSADHAAMRTVEDGRNVLAWIFGVDDGVADERRKRTRQTQPGGLMAARAVGSVELLAPAACACGSRR